MTDSTSAPLAWQLAGAKWRFFVTREDLTDALHWRWRAVGLNRVVWQDDRDFDTLALCQADAASHGFEGAS